MDTDLQSRQEARTMARQAELAQKKLGVMTGLELDRIVEAVAQAFYPQAEALAEMAVQETGFGNKEDKTVKNQFASRTLLQAIAPLKTVGVLKKDSREKLWEVGVPVGVIAGIVPSTNPTSTVCYKAMIALKAGNAIVFSPHPKALRCTLHAAKIAAAAAEAAGAPAGAVSCLTIPSLAGCRELMGAPEVRLILATGGPAMVQAAYSSGKPAIGVGAGNGPAYLHRSCNVEQALRKILRSKSFDNGTVCASEQSIVVERELAGAVEETGKKLGYYFLDPQEAQAVGRVLFRPGGALNPEIVGKTPDIIGKKAGISIPEGTKILVAPGEGVGEAYPYSMEKLCPVLGYYVTQTAEESLSLCRELLELEGRGHTFCFHGEDLQAVEQFAAQIPVSRFLVNTPGALGGIGATTGLFPALTLGCGAVGGSSSSNNIGPMDLINIRRVAWDREQTEEPDMPDLVERLTEKILRRLENQEKEGSL